MNNRDAEKPIICVKADNRLLFYRSRKVSLVKLVKMTKQMLKLVLKTQNMSEDLSEKQYVLKMILHFSVT